jgi:hypothetical protein
MPELFLAGVVPAAGCAVLGDAPLVTILALSFAVGWAFSLVPLALACLALSIAKKIR